MEREVPVKAHFFFLYQIIQHEAGSIKLLAASRSMQVLEIKSRISR